MTFEDVEDGGNDVGIDYGDNDGDNDDDYNAAGDNHDDDDMSQFPLVPGHELAGVVTQVGAGVTDVKVTRLRFI